MKTALAGLWILAATQPCLAQDTKSFQFLKIGPAARASGLGGAFSAIADDEASLYYNPAGIAGVTKPSFIFSYVNHTSGIQSGMLGYVRPLTGKYYLGASITYFSYGDFIRADQFGNQLGEFGSSDWSFNLSGAVSVLPQVKVGATGKFIYEKIEQFSASGLGFDLGILLALSDKRTRLAGVAQNLGSELESMGSESFGLPTSFKLGIAHILKESGVLISAEGVKPSGGDLFFNFGAELTQIKPLALRAGYSTLAGDIQSGQGGDKWAGAAFGIGLLWQRYKLDYSFSTLSALGGVHRITISGGVN